MPPKRLAWLERAREINRKSIRQILLCQIYFVACVEIKTYIFKSASKTFLLAITVFVLNSHLVLQYFVKLKSHSFISNK